MNIAGSRQSPVEYAQECKIIWSHLDESECREQVEAHMESERYTWDEIDAAIYAVGLALA